MTMDTGAKIFIGAALIFTVFIGVMAQIESKRKEQQKEQPAFSESNLTNISATATNAWFFDKWRMQLQDEHGQVYNAERLHSNRNIYVVWLMQDDTNGITNAWSYKHRWFLEGNWIIGEKNGKAMEFPPIYAK
jgi:hypothetical protein